MPPMSPTITVMLLFLVIIFALSLALAAAVNALLFALKVVVFVVVYSVKKTFALAKKCASRPLLLSMMIGSTLYVIKGVPMKHMPLIGTMTKADFYWIRDASNSTIQSLIASKSSFTIPSAKLLEQMDEAPSNIRAVFPNATGIDFVPPCINAMYFNDLFHDDLRRSISDSHKFRMQEPAESNLPAPTPADLDRNSVDEYKHIIMQASDLTENDNVDPVLGNAYGSAELNLPSELGTRSTESDGLVSNNAPMSRLCIDAIPVFMIIAILLSVILVAAIEIIFFMSKTAVLLTFYLMKKAMASMKKCIYLLLLLIGAPVYALLLVPFKLVSVIFETARTVMKKVGLQTTSAAKSLLAIRPAELLENMEEEAMFAAQLFLDAPGVDYILVTLNDMDLETLFNSEFGLRNVGSHESSTLHASNKKIDPAPVIPLHDVRRSKRKTVIDVSNLRRSPRLAKANLLASASSSEAVVPSSSTTLAPSLSNCDGDRPLRRSPRLAEKSCTAAVSSESLPPSRKSKKSASTAPRWPKMSTPSSERVPTSECCHNQHTSDGIAPQLPEQSPVLSSPPCSEQTPFGSILRRSSILFNPVAPRRSNRLAGKPISKNVTWKKEVRVLPFTPSNDEYLIGLDEMVERNYEETDLISRFCEQWTDIHQNDGLPNSLVAILEDLRRWNIPEDRAQFKRAFSEHILLLRHEFYTGPSSTPPMRLSPAAIYHGFSLGGC